jgi:hypothetical protein
MAFFACIFGMKACRGRTADDVLSDDNDFDDDDLSPDVSTRATSLMPSVAAGSSELAATKSPKVRGGKDGGGTAGTTTGK